MSQLNAVNIGYQPMQSSMVPKAPMTSGKEVADTTRVEVSNDNYIPSAGLHEDIKAMTDAHAMKVSIPDSFIKGESHFSVDDELQQIIVQIINSDTKELIRQIPTEDALSLSKHMNRIIALLYD